MKWETRHCGNLRVVPQTEQNKNNVRNGVIKSSLTRVQSWIRFFGSSRVKGRIRFLRRNENLRGANAYIDDILRGVRYIFHSG
jgi:hypothetical protein